MLRVSCVFCKAEWSKPSEGANLVSHGACTSCIPLWEAVIDGKMSMEAAKLAALKSRELPMHDTSARAC